jgi:hypothetical protein
MWRGDRASGETSGPDAAARRAWSSRSAGLGAVARDANGCPARSSTRCTVRWPTPTSSAIGWPSSQRREPPGSRPSSPERTEVSTLERGQISRDETMAIPQWRSDEEKRDSSSLSVARQAPPGRHGLRPNAQSAGDRTRNAAALTQNGQRSPSFVQHHQLGSPDWVVLSLAQTVGALSR